MLYMPLCPGLQYPANVALVYDELRDIIFFDILPTDLIDEKIYYFPEENAYNNN